MISGNHGHPLKKTAGKQERRRKAAPVYVKALKWALALGVMTLVVYGVSQMSGVAYNESAIGVVDFSELNPAAKRTALRAANAARCNCGCGMTLAQCVATDSTCPIRTGNIDRIKAMVRDASRN
jgi:hypothetical protein